MDKQITEDISPQDADDFLRAIKNTINSMTQVQIREVHYYDHRKKAIVISFDKLYLPFFGKHWGLNPLEDRIPIQNFGFVLRLIGSRLRECPNWIPAGRVFLTRYEAYHQDQGNNKEIHCKWEWPGTLDIVKEICNLF
jgi:hypothetical protein